MAMVAASQRLTEMGLDEDADNDDDDDDGGDDDDHLHHRHSHVIEEEMMDDLDEYGDEDDDDDDEDDDGPMYSGGMAMYAPEQQHSSEDMGDHSQSGSEERDVFEDLDNPMTLEYQWNPPRASGVLEEDSVLSEFQMSSGVSGSGSASAINASAIIGSASVKTGSASDNHHLHHVNESQQLHQMQMQSHQSQLHQLQQIQLQQQQQQSQSQTQNSSSSSSIMEPTMILTQDEMIHRLSFGEPFLRRTSQAESLKSEEGSFKSAPARAGREPTTSPYDAEGGQPRPLSIAVPNAEGAAHSRHGSQRRSSVTIKPFSSTSNINNNNNNNDADKKNYDYNTDHSSSTERVRSGGAGGGGLLNSFIGNRRSSRRQNLSIMQGRSSVMGNLDNAIASLRKQDSNSEWENVAAAAAVVAASSQGGNVKSRHTQFAVDDTVLVFLTLLNVTNMEDPKDTFTVAPVNAYGYPLGEGTTELEKNGPYSFVLATVKHVHFDEDDRYYTIVRSDTGTEQRADSGTSSHFLFLLCICLLASYLKL
jgi:hypothetical protein